MSTTPMVPMIAPDGTSGSIPQDKVAAAAAAGFKQAVEMTSRDGQGGYIPVDRQQDALKAGFTPTALTQKANSTEGMYKMVGPGGQNVQVPFSKVRGAQDSQFQVVPSDAQRYQKDAQAAAPSFRDILQSNLQNNTQDLQPDGGILHDYVARPLLHVANRMAKDVGGAALSLLNPPSYAPASDAQVQQAGDVSTSPGSVVEGLLNQAPVVGAPASQPRAGIGTQIRNYVHAAKTNPAAALGDVVGDAGTTALLAGIAKGPGGSSEAATVPGQNYSPSHAAAFEGGIAPATAMGRNFVPQDVTPQALSPIRETAARMSQGSPADQSLVKSVTSSSTPPLQRVKAYQGIVQRALDDLEAQHAPALARVQNVPVDTAPIVKELQSQISPTMDPADVSAIRNLMMRVKQAKTIGDLGTFRQELNTETAPQYRQSQVQAGRTGISAQATSDLADSVRSAYYDNLQKATGIDFAPLKRQEASLINTQESLQNQKAPLAKSEAQFAAPTTLREKAGNVANLIKDPKNTVTQTILRESPATKVATLLGKSLDDLPPAQPVPSPAQPRIAGLLPRGAIVTPEPALGTNPPSAPPPFNYTTRAQRLGLLLPDKSGGPIELPYHPQMGNDEQLVALQHMLRQSMPLKALPAKVRAIPLPRRQ